jgi:hypothetical protein
VICITVTILLFKVFINEAHTSDSETYDGTDTTTTIITILLLISIV